MCCAQPAVLLAAHVATSHSCICAQEALQHLVAPNSNMRGLRCLLISMQTPANCKPPYQHQSRKQVLQVHRTDSMGTAQQQRHSTRQQRGKRQHSSTAAAAFCDGQLQQQQICCSCSRCKGTSKACGNPQHSEACTLVCVRNCRRHRGPPPPKHTLGRHVLPCIFE